MKNLNKAKFISTSAFNSIKKQFASLGYPNTIDDGEITIWDDDKAIVKAMPHSNSKSYIMAYDTNYMEEQA